MGTARRKKKKRRVMIKRMRSRLFVLLSSFQRIIFAVIFGAIVYYNLRHGKDYTERILSQKGYESIIVPYKRGDIYDCNGSVLATSTMVYNVVIEPKNILKFEKNKKATLKALDKYFSVSAEEAAGYLENKDSWYEVIRKKLTYDDVKEYLADERDGKLTDVVGIRLEEEYKRTYPNNELACHMLGFVVSGNEGIGGIEGSYNSYLNGQNGRKYSYLGEDYNLQREVEQPVNGNSLVTTIDSETQTNCSGKM